MRKTHEILGDLDEILGDEYSSEMVGAGLVPQFAPARQNGYQIGRSQVRTQKASKSRQAAMPIDSVTVLVANETRTISIQPQVLFRPERLVVGDITNFLINDLKVGKNSQFVASGAFPSSVFGPTAVGVTLRMDTCQVSMIIALSVTNTDGGASHRFNGALLGTSVE